MAVILPTPGPDDVWGGPLNQAIRAVEQRVTTIEDTGGTNGADGKSAYQVAVDNGFVGTVSEWLASLVGPKGDTGNPGDPGADGREVALRLGATGIEWQYVGDTGWALLVTLADITGPQGAPGADSTVPGPDGDSAYQVWLDAGNTGTEADFLASLKGEPGDAGLGTRTLGTQDQVASMTVVGDGTDTATWPNRWEWLFQPVAGVASLVQWVNEYGEARVMPARNSTVGWRLFLKETAAAAARTVAGFQIVDNRQDRNPIMEVDDDEVRANKQLRTPTVTQDRTDTTPAAWTTNLTGAVATALANIAEHRVGGKMVAWANEWGAWRFTAPYAWGDAGTRYIRDDTDPITSGNATELVDRRTGANDNIMWGRRWTDGSLVRNGNVMADTVVVAAGTTDAAIEAMGLPPGTVVYEASA